MYFRAEDGDVIYKNGKLDMSLNGCRDTSYPVSIDVAHDGSVFFSGPVKLAVPEYDSARRTTRYATNNITTFTNSTCIELHVSRSVFQVGVPSIVAKHFDGSIIVAYFPRPKGSDVLLRRIGEEPLHASLIENPADYDVRMIKPLEDGWLFCLVRNTAVDRDGVVFVRTDKSFNLLDRYVPEHKLVGSFMFCEVTGDRILILTDYEVRVMDARTMTTLVGYDKNEVVPEAKRLHGTTLVSAAILGDKLIVGSNQGYAVMAIPATSVAEHQQIRQLQLGSFDAEFLCDPACEPQVIDVTGKVMNVQFRRDGDRVRLNGADLPSGVNFVRTCDNIIAVISTVR